MNRRQKIMVSVTGIFIVMLILVGLTYAYFLTRIIGNTNNRSISVTTANLVLTYGDGNGVLEVGDKLRPGSSVNFKTSSGTTVNEKTFSVTNSGDATDYVVIVDNVNVTPEPFESNDFIYTLTCSSSDSNPCDGNDSIFPLKNQGILVGNKIAAGVTHTYTLTMEYKETGENQSDDMGKTFTARINIEDIRRLDNPYAYNEDSLAYNIINNSVNATNGTQLRAKPVTDMSKGTSEYWTGEYNYSTYSTKSIEDAAMANCESEPILYIGDTYDEAWDRRVYSYSDAVGHYLVEDCDGVPIGYVDSYDEDAGIFTIREDKIMANAESTLSFAEDDYGTSYYYRGDIKDNYVDFAGFIWRIVRINGDGSIRVILDGSLDRTKKEGEETFVYQNEKLKSLNLAYISSTNESYFENGLIKFHKASGYGSYGYGRSDYIYNALIGYMYGVPASSSYDLEHQNLNNSQVKTYLDTFYEEYIQEYSEYLSDTLFCGDKSLASTYSKNTSGFHMNTTYYSAYERIIENNKNVTLECAKGDNNTYSRYSSDSSQTIKGVRLNNDLKYPIGLLTADEQIYAGAYKPVTNGGEYNEMANRSYYLYDAVISGKSYRNWWTMTPSYYRGTSNLVDSKAYVFLGGESLNSSMVTYGGGLAYYAMRPVINLKSNTIITGGNGTETSPYILKEISG